MLLRCLMMLTCCAASAAAEPDAADAASGNTKYAVAPVLESADADYALEGYLRGRIDRVIGRFFLEVPETSPAILQVLRDRDRTPKRDPLMPWAGEFAGKFLTAAVQTWRLTGDAALKAMIDGFVADLVAAQAPDGYLGPFPKEERLTGKNWDVWGHYHCILGLMLYHEDTQYEPALQACMKAADLLHRTFGPGGPTLTNDDAGGQMNMAVCHALLLLYRKTGVARYRELAEYIVHEAWNEPGAGRYLEAALAGKPMVEVPQHRWEAIHDWQALAELYWLTGENDYRAAFEHLWHEGLFGDRHNTGGVTSGEGFQGNPYHQGAIETCCTVAWIAFSIDMLRMTGDPRVADEIEWSTLNSALGAIPYGGRVCAYNVPMEGTRTFGLELHWQSPKAGPDLNCCSVNANRPLGMISDWALMRHDGGLTLNFYGPGAMEAALGGGNRVRFVQETAYPVGNTVRLAVYPAAPAQFALRLRIPGWSRETRVTVNGALVEAVRPGYLALEREWREGDQVEIAFDFSPRFWVGAENYAGQASVYRGPLLYAYDARYNTLDPHELPPLDAHALAFEPAAWDGAVPPWALFQVRDGAGHSLAVCDFSSAGQTGNHYRSWLPIEDPAMTEAKGPAVTRPARPVSIAKIWDAGEHNAFTDIARWRDRWWVTFREADGHVKGDGKIRVITSGDGTAWESAALLAEDGIDLRDPKFGVTPDDRLMIVAGGSVYEGDTLVGRQPRVAFSADGTAWTPTRRVLHEGEWLWRVTWHEGRCYGAAYAAKPDDEWALTLYAGEDGIEYEKVAALDVPGHPNETTLRFLPDGRMVALVRREAESRNAWVGHSAPPHTDWTWTELDQRIGGPNFIVLPGGAMWAGGRQYGPDGASTVLARMTTESCEPVYTLPSGGDTSYPGFAWHDGLLWMSYYASHEGKTSIYLARFRLPW